MTSLTSLDDIRLDVLENSINLLSHELRWNMMNGVHPCRVLCCQSSSCRHGIAAMCSYDLLVRFKSALAQPNQLVYVILHLRE